MSDLHLRNLPVPFFSQRKNGYIWKDRYVGADFKDVNNPLIGQIKPDGDKYSMACNSCNITSIAMVLHYYGLSTESPDDIMRRYFDREAENDKAALGDLPTAVNALQQWVNLRDMLRALYAPEIKRRYGQDAADNFVTYYNADIKISTAGQLTIKQIKDAIAEGYPVIANHGGLDSSGSIGHIVVIRGFAKIQGTEYIIFNDPYGAPGTADGSILSGGIMSMGRSCSILRIMFC